MKLSDEQLKYTNRQTKELIGSLILVFLLGVSLTTIFEYDPSELNILEKSILGIHILVAIWILIVGIIRTYRSYQWKHFQKESTIGLISSIIAISAGSAATGSGNDVAVFFMAVGFIIGLVAYGKILVGLKVA